MNGGACTQMDTQINIVSSVMLLLVGVVSCSGLSQVHMLNLRMNTTFQDQEWVVKTIPFSFENSSLPGDFRRDIIKGSLPGQPSKVPFDQYAGHIIVDEAKGRSLFYYFAEATDSPSLKPIVLWLNGGPGCSSLGMGAFMENGPFGVENDGKTLYTRHYSWNKVANMLYLESPAGVGFSYSNYSLDYNTTGDRRTAQDSYMFLVKWFKRFSHFRTSNLYIIGESYAGLYIPELADTILHNNKQEDLSLIIHLKGVMVGNAMINAETDTRGLYDYYWSHALLSDDLHQGVMGCLDTKGDCSEIIRKVVEEFGAGYNDFSNIYPQSCPLTSNDDQLEEVYVKIYLNNPHVQHALHANTMSLPYSWELCSLAFQPWKDSLSSMYPIYRRLIMSGLRIFIYSGDVDAIIPITSTRYSISGLNLTVTKPWRPWFDVNKEVAGYREDYKGLTFMSVRQAGHQVPRSQPRRAFGLLKTFLHET